MEPVLRVAVVYLALLVAFRIMGKRELGRLSPFELVTLMLIPEIVSPAISRDEASLTGALIGACTLFLMVLGTSLVNHLVPGAARVLEGNPTLLVKNGEFVTDTMNKERVDPEEVYAEMHRVGLEDVSEVRWAILEREGEITIIPKSRRMQVPPRAEQVPQ